MRLPLCMLKRPQMLIASLDMVTRLIMAPVVRALGLSAAEMARGRATHLMAARRLVTDWRCGLCLRRVLTGGTTTCDVFSGADYYGKLSVVRPCPFALYSAAFFQQSCCRRAWWYLSL